MRSRRRIRQARRPALALGAALAVWLAVPAPAEAAREGRACEAEPTDMIIEYGDLITCAIRPAGDSDLFRLAGSSGQTVRLQLADLTAGAATPCLQLRDPAGEPLPGRLCGSGGGDFLLERTGTYGIVVTENPDDRAQVVRYALVAERIDPTSPAAVPIKHGQAIADEIRRAGDLDSYFLEAEAGDRIALEIADRTPGAPAPCFQLYDPTGAALAGPVCGNRSVEFLLEKAGRHSILVTERARARARAVGYDLRLSCISGICPDPGFEEVFGCLTLRGAPLRENRVRFTQPGEERQIDLTDVRGCAKFLPVAGKPFGFRLGGPLVPD